MGVCNHTAAYLDSNLAFEIKIATTQKINLNFLNCVELKMNQCLLFVKTRSILIFNLKNIFQWVKRELALKNWFQVHTEEKFDVIFWRLVEPAKQKTMLTGGVMWRISCVVTSFSCGKLNVLNFGGKEENLAKPAIRDDTRRVCLVPSSVFSALCLISIYSSITGKPYFASFQKWNWESEGVRKGRNRSESCLGLAVLWGAPHGPGGVTQRILWYLLSEELPGAWKTPSPFSHSN